MFSLHQHKRFWHLNLCLLGENIVKVSKKEKDCLAVLLDEIQQAVVWSRPSVLIAVHQSKNDQLRVMNTAKEILNDLQLESEWIIPESGESNILRDIVQKSVSPNTVYFVQGLGTRLLLYQGLNLYRELLVDQQLKLIFWLTSEEVNLLSRKAPDFWAFRHRVIEFPTKRSSRKSNLPSGVLLWHHEALKKPVDDVYDKIAFYKTRIQNLPSQDETIVSHADALVSLAYYFWAIGESKEVFDLLHREIEKIKQFDLNAIHSTLLNALAINSFDQENYQESLQQIEQAVELSPANSLLWSNLGIICRSTGQSRKSFPSLKKAVRLTPASSECWGSMGYLYMFLGKYEDAFPLFEKALAIHPEAVRFYPALAVCHSKMGNIENFNKFVQQIENVAKKDEYFLLYRAGLIGDEVSVVKQLRELASSDKTTKVFIRRDPNLRFVLSSSLLQEIL